MTHENDQFHEHDDDGYEGPATLVIEGEEFPVEVKLAGCFQPIDGRYHWYGRIADNPPVTAAVADRGKTPCTFATPHAEVEGTLSDPDLWNRYRISGVGTPPFHVVSTIEEVGV
ncbi:DUF4873 domain-containing protein [Streptomyces sp. NPDC056656]|uniref:DUF4873 domain-containing protein n=1 Tax=Streptomyces sp. NPDC056656 TaxID=3345895 RepID=UPI0036A2271A